MWKTSKAADHVGMRVDEQAPEVIRQTQVFMDGDNKENVMKVEFSLRDVSRTMNNGNRDYRKAVK